MCRRVRHLFAGAIVLIIHSLCQCNTFQMIVSFEFFRPHYGSGVDPPSISNEFQEYFLKRKEGRYLGLTTLPPSCADCLEIQEPQPPGTLRACPRQNLHIKQANTERKSKNKTSLAWFGLLCVFGYKLAIILI